MSSLFDDKFYLKPEKKILTEKEAANALRNAWKNIFGEYPNNKSLGVLWAKTKLETGNFRIGFYNYNFGNIKSKNKDEYFTMFECGEEISLQQAEQFLKETPDLVKIKAKYTKKGKPWASVLFYPGHLWSKFVAFKTLDIGAEYYIKFLCEKSRYKKAWEKVLAGNPAEFSHELSVAGYYTANETNYTKTVVKNFNEFMNKIDLLIDKEEIIPEIKEEIIPEIKEEIIPEIKEEIIPETIVKSEEVPKISSIKEEIYVDNIVKQTNIVSNQNNVVKKTTDKNIIIVIVSIIIIVINSIINFF